MLSGEWSLCSSVVNGWVRQSDSSKSKPQILFMLTSLVSITFSVSNLKRISDGNNLKVMENNTTMLGVAWVPSVSFALYKFIFRELEVVELQFQGKCGKIIEGYLDVVSLQFQGAVVKRQ